MNIYMLKNFSQKEVYFGLSEGDAHAAVISHRNNPDSPIGHWGFDRDQIKWGLVQEDLSEVYAPAFLQALRREPVEEGWVQVVGID